MSNCVARNDLTCNPCFLVIEQGAIDMALEAKVWGAFFTCANIAQFLVRWAIRDRDDIVLEPSFGDGAFIGVSIDRLVSLGGSNANLFGVEIREEAAKGYVKSNRLLERNCFHADFMELSPFPVDVVVGNPPYIRMKNLQKATAQLAVQRSVQLGVNMAASGSLWMPFIIHAMSFLKLGGRLAFVLPHEMTHVKYAVPLWRHLCSNFSSISVIRTHEDLFPDNEEETILLMADGYGHSCDSIQYSLYDKKQDLFSNNVIKETRIPLTQIVNGNRPFTRALLNDEQLHLIQELTNTCRIAQISRDCKFKIGYVTGDKKFFHPDINTRTQYSLPPENLFTAVINSRQLRGKGVTISKSDVETVLYQPSVLTQGDREYIQFGQETEVSQRYKCKVRNPWYVTPGVKVPDFLLTVFSERPLLLENVDGMVASNSLLCGFKSNQYVDSNDLLCRWYNSFTLLSIELEVHSLGGGVLVLIPGEADNIQIPSYCDPTRARDVVRQIDAYLKNDEIEQAYSLGDDFVLKYSLGLSNVQIHCIREGLDVLRKWRTKGKRSGDR